MPLTPGTRLGVYDVTAPLGQGGMGEVWKARDTKLGRDVALKTLPDAFASDPDRLARFEREARLLASLNHPSIGSIYGFEQSGETRFLVLELVEGDTLADRLTRGAIPVEEALGLALQIAEALEAAHEKGIIHRDLKPANIKVTPEGKVKVLDFGLAKAFEGEQTAVSVSQSPTLSMAATRQGIVLGTAAYMSPEQAKGRPADRRADIWAFGCVLYEMLTARQPFGGETAADCLAAVLEREPDFAPLLVTGRPQVAALVRRCLAKEPRERLRDIGDARLELRDAIAGGGPGDGRHEPSGPRARLPWVGVALAATVLVLVGWALGRAPTIESAPPEATRLALLLPRGQDGSDSLASSPVLVSPDGRTLVYGARAGEGRYLYRQSLGTFEPVRIDGSAGAEFPFFSFDGEWLGFKADGQLKKVPLLGGEAIPIAPAARFILGASWGSDGTIVYADGQSTGLWRVSAGGGTPRALTSPQVALTGGHRFPYQLPDGRGILFGIGGFGGQPAMLAFLPSGSTDWREIRAASTARFSAMHYLPAGYLVYGQDGTIFAGRFDLDRLEFTSEPRPVVPDVASSPTSQYVSFSVSDNGTLVYVPASAALNGPQLVRIQPRTPDAGIETVARLRGATATGSGRVSPAGDRLAVGVRTAGVSDVWSYGLQRGDELRLTQGAEAGEPAWMPGGEALTVSMRGNLYTVVADGTRPPELLLEREGVQTPLSWSGDGSLLLFREIRPETGADLLTFSPADGRVAPLHDGPANESDGALSPDGRLVAYISDETGRDEVYLEALGGAGQRQPVSVDGGDTPRWTPDGTALLYRRGQDLMRVPVSGSPRRAGRAEVFLSASDGVSLDVGYGITTDGAVVAVRNPSGAGEPTELRIVFNWTEELKRLVPE